MDVCGRCRARLVPQIPLCPQCGHDRSLEGGDRRIVGGRYQLGRLLGSGGMGRVFEAVDLETKEEVALKMLHAIDAASLSRFRREALAIERLDHPAAVRLRAFETPVDLAPFIVMERIDGATLDEVLDTERILPPTRIRRILAQVLDVLAAAHERSVLHRDLKPSNIMLLDEDRVKICDFGGAKILEGDGSTRITRTGHTLGTPAYMAPEQIENRAVDGRADLYSVGVLLYRMLSGRLPFESQNREALLYQQLLQAPRPPSQVADAEVPHAMEVVCLRALAKQPEARYPNARAMAEALTA
ncbi:MAG: serine/threonine-protein kinase [Deltaproteobacteria bacterium]